jgi:hypothetical protein
MTTWAAKDLPLPAPLLACQVAKLLNELRHSLAWLYDI